MENLLDKESVKRVVKVLSDFDSNLKVEALNSSARTAVDAAASLNCEVGAIVKSLLLRTDDSFIHKIKILIDSSFSRYENVYAAAGHPNSIFKISYKQLIKLTEGIEEDIVLWESQKL